MLTNLRFLGPPVSVPYRFQVQRSWSHCSLIQHDWLRQPGLEWGRRTKRKEDGKAKLERQNCATKHVKALITRDATNELREEEIKGVL